MSLKCRPSHVFHYVKDNLHCYTSQLKYVIRLEEDVSRDMRQNFRLTRDQVVHLKTAANLAGGKQISIQEDLPFLLNVPSPELSKVQCRYVL